MDPDLRPVPHGSTYNALRLESGNGFHCLALAGSNQAPVVEDCLVPKKTVEKLDTIDKKDTFKLVNPTDTKEYKVVVAESYLLVGQLGSG